MERFRFGEQEGANGRITTFNGSVQVEPDYPDPRFCAVVTLGPSGGERARMIIDKATAGKLGAALMKWAGVSTMDVLITEQKRLLVEMNQGPTIGTPEAGHHPGSVADPRD